MILYSEEIYNFLYKIFAYETSHWDGHGELTPIHNRYEAILHNLDKRSKHSLSPTFPINRDKLFSIILDNRFEIAYSFDGTTVSVEYYIKIKKVGDWLDYIIESFEQKLNRIITETLNRVIRESILTDNRKRKVLG